LVLAWVAGRFVDVNIFSLQGVYASRLIRCYLGASRTKVNLHTDRPRGASPHSHGPDRNANLITGFDPLDDMPLADLKVGGPTPVEGLRKKEQPTTYRGPVLLINTALNLVRGEELAWQERKAESFVLTARYCGCRNTGYRPTEGYGAGLGLGAAMSISGAAVSPNMGYHSSGAVTALLTLFNARLGAWLDNPREPCWQARGPRSSCWHPLKELLGRTDDRYKYVYLSDGGHFENLGVYELVRRRCRFIILCDGTADPDFRFQDLGNLIRKVRIDFGVRIEIDLSGLQRRQDGRAASHAAIGKIHYGDVDRRQGTPHDSTLNKFFTESQFESYCELGYHTARTTFYPVIQALRSSGWKDGRAGDSRQLFGQLHGQFYPPPPDLTLRFLESTRGYIAVLESLRTDPNLRRLIAEVHGSAPAGDATPNGGPAADRPEACSAERHMVAQMMMVLENAWFGLHLERYRRHPVHNGWMGVFKRWWEAPTVQTHWPAVRCEFNHGFRDFLERELGKLPDLCGRPKDLGKCGTVLTGEP
jgi:hypothetical protein